MCKLETVRSSEGPLNDVFVTLVTEFDIGVIPQKGSKEKICYLAINP